MGQSNSNESFNEVCSTEFKSIQNVSSILSQAALDLSFPGRRAFENFAVPGNLSFLHDITFGPRQPINDGTLQLKSIDELLNSGVIVDSRPIGFQLNPSERMNNFAQAVISGNARVLESSRDSGGVFVTAAPGLNIEPDLLIRKDGSVEMRHEPSRPPILIQVETAPGDVGPTDAQSHAAREIGRWLEDRQIQEQRNLNEAESQKNVDGVNQRFDQDGSMSQKDAQEYFPQRETPQQKEPEPFDKAAVLDTVAYMFHPDKKNPYDTIRQGVHGYEIGRYGLGADLYFDYLSELDEFAEVMGSPADMRKLPQLMKRLAKAGKVPAKFAKQFDSPEFCQEYSKFLGKLSSGHGKLSTEDLHKFFPKEMQESVMKGVVDKCEKAGTEASTLALAMHLAKPVSKLSEADFSDKKNQEYMAAATKVLGFALASHQAAPGDTIDWKKPSHKNQSEQTDFAGKDEKGGSALAFSIAKAAEHNANRVGTVGWCYREVANTLDRFGIHLSGRSAYMAAPQLANNKHFKEVSLDHLKKGTVLVFGPSDGHPHGHITVYLGNGMEASDHVQRLVNFKNYGGVRAFEAR